MKEFDQMTILNSQGTEIGGFLKVMSEEYYVHLILKKKSFPHKVQLKGSETMLKLLKPVLVTLEQHLNQCNTVEDMLSEIQNTLEQQIRTSGTSQATHRLTECTALFQHLQELGWEKIHYASPDFQEIHLKATDEADRDHILKICIPDKFPHEGPKCECDLPQEFNYKWLPNDTLSSMFSVFEEKLQQFAEFWNCMDELDSNTWILEPEKPNRKDCKRRIALASGISLLLVINPALPLSIPMCHYLGPEKIVEPMRNKFNKNIHLWSEYDSILTNLQQVLELEFPSPLTSEKEEFCTECGICYSYLLNDAVPGMTCDNLNCQQPFHHACLYEYIRTLPDVRSSFNKLFGNCPYCSKPLWCSIP